MRSIVILTAMGLSSAANAAIVTQWNFNTLDGSSATGTTLPAIGAGTASVIGGVTATFASGNSNGGSTDPETSSDDTAWNTTTYAAQGTGSGTRGVQFMVSTAGVLDGLYVTFDLRHSNTSSRYVQFEYTLDGGASWSTTGMSLNGAAFDGLFEHIGGDTWFNNQRVDLFNVPAASNNPDFGFRITAVFAPSTTGYIAANPASTYASTGTLRYDMVTVNTPAPGAAALLALGGILVARRRR